MQANYRLKMTELGYTFPLFNKINSLSKSLTPDEQSWFKGERNCCGDFEYYYLKSDNLYKKSTNYLKKARETDRSPIPTYITILIIVILGLESWGFSYIFAGYAIPGASEQVQQYGGLGIAIFIAVILSVLTHEVGREWYINFKLKEYHILKGHKEFKYDNTEVTIDDTFSDDSHQEFEKLGNRIGVAHNHSYIKTIVTAIFIIIVAAGAWYVRQEALSTDIREQMEFMSLTADQAVNTKHAGEATFAILSVVFIFLQLIGALFGNKWGFMGKESEKSYYIAHKFNTSQDFEHQKSLWNKQINELAEKYLVGMQHKISQRIKSDIRGATSDQNKAIAMMPQKTFKQYMKNIQQGRNAFDTVRIKEGTGNKEGSDAGFDDVFTNKKAANKPTKKSEIGFQPAAKVETTVNKVSQNKNDFFSELD